MTDVPFIQTVGFKVMISVVVVVGVTVIVVPTAVCLTGHCGGSDVCNDWTCEAADTPWSYDGENNGPSCWSKCYPACGLSSQSPIDLINSDAITLPADTLVMQGQDDVLNITLFNNGHTIQGDLPGHLQTTIQGLGLPGEYRGQQFHFHWGEDSTRGSEHYINGGVYPMELHIVHYSTNYSNFGEAADKPNGLAVLGFLYEIAETNNTYYLDLIESVENIPFKDDSTELFMSLRDLYNRWTPTQFGNYYRYSGSLTTPACYESIVWTVLTEPIPIAEEQLAKFREVFHGDDDLSHNIYDNFRPLQPLNDRQVGYGSFL